MHTPSTAAPTRPPAAAFGFVRAGGGRAGGGGRAPPRAPRAAAGDLQFFATCHPGLEEVVAAELAAPAVGAADVRPGRAGVAFSGSPRTLYNANLWLRAAVRVLQLLDEVALDPSAPPGDAAYAAVRAARADWPALIPHGRTFSVDARAWDCTALRNSALLAARARDAVCDAVRERRGVRPAPPARGRAADVPLFAAAYKDRLTLYRDASGESLHRRGYRAAMHRASLNEAAAAGCLALAGWPALAAAGGGNAALADPMAGSGTFLIEAALMATNTAPGLFRERWPCVEWPDADPEAWRDAVASARDARRPGGAAGGAPPRLWGNDAHGGALALAARDAEAAGVRSLIRLHSGDAAEWRLPAPPQLVVCNPPWGQRLASGDGDEGGGGGARGPSRGDGFEEEVSEELAGAWRHLGHFLKRQAVGAEAFVLSGNPAATRAMRLRADRRLPITIGGVDCRLLKYEIR
jgi:putative N6-adenine-specific DNA methylase